MTNNKGEQGRWVTNKYGNRVFIPDKPSLYDKAKRALEERRVIVNRRAEKPELYPLTPVVIQPNPEFHTKLIEVERIADETVKLRERRKLVKEHIMTKLRGEYLTNEEIIVMVSRATATKYISYVDGIKAKVTPQLAELLEEGEIFKIEKGINDDGTPRADFDYFLYYNVKFKIDNQVYDGVLNVGLNTQNNSATLYELNSIK
jgi:hypothetical protein